MDDILNDINGNSDSDDIPFWLLNIKWYRKGCDFMSTVRENIYKLKEKIT